MAAADPVELIIESICAPEGRRIVRGGARSGWQTARTMDGPFVSAVRDSIVMRKERRAGPQRAYVVSYRTSRGEDYLEIRGARQGPDGSWSLTSSAGGTGHGPRDQPWVNFGGWWGPDVFAAGGELTGLGADDAARVDLLFDGVPTLSDSVENGVVLFLATGALRGQATARIVDPNGQLLSTQLVFPAGFGPPGAG